MNSLKLDKRALELARKQFCLDIGMPWEEYLKDPRQKVYIRKAVYRDGTLLNPTEGARNYEGRDDFFHAMICLGQLFLSVDEQIYDWAVETFGKHSPEWFCAYGNLRMIDEKLAEYGHRIRDTHVYFLPEEMAENIDAGAVQNSARDIQSGISRRNEGAGNRKPNRQFVRYEREEILRFQADNRFTSAICFSKTQPDMLAVAALKEDAMQMHNDDGSIGKKDDPFYGDADGDKLYDQSLLAGMAGASADGEYLWQIGINVIPEAAGQGLAHELVRSLKEDILQRGKIPFYGTSESHMVSQNVGLKAGFVPAWTEVYAEPAGIIGES